MEASTLTLLISLSALAILLLILMYLPRRAGGNRRSVHTQPVSGRVREHHWESFDTVLISLDYYPTSTEVEIGELFVSVSVTAANVVNDIRENIRNLVGGRMHHYERLIDGAIHAALTDLDAKAKAKGYDGVIGVKISHPTVVDGGVEVIVYGNGFKRRATGGA